MVGGEVFCGVGIARVRVVAQAQAQAQVQVPGRILIVLVLFRCLVETLGSLACLCFVLALVLAVVALVEVFPRGSGPGSGIPG